MQWFKKIGVFSLLLFSIFRLWGTDEGLDLVVLVDQSGSMTGEGSKAKNDPKGVRNDIVRMTLETLVLNGTNNKVTNKLGVISFGSIVRLDFPLTEVGEQNLDALRSQLKASLKNNSLGNTDFLAAFEKAQQLFSTNATSTNSNRKKGLIQERPQSRPDFPVRYHPRNKENPALFSGSARKTDLFWNKQLSPRPALENAGYTAGYLAKKSADSQGRGG